MRYEPHMPDAVDTALSRRDRALLVAGVLILYSPAALADWLDRRTKGAHSWKPISTFTDRSRAGLRSSSALAHRC